MTTRADPDNPTMAWAGESLLRVTLPADDQTPGQRPRLRAWLDALTPDPIGSLIDAIPGYAVLTLVFDGARLDPERAEGDARRVLGEAEPPAGAGTPGRIVEVPVCYDDGCAPDLTSVCAHTGLTPSEVVERHTGASYEVAFVGFTPGFGYLRGLDPRLATPRLASPRTRVPSGSVGIAGHQTGVYPHATPGGWRLIGRTPLAMFDAQREPSSLLRAGDAVRFVAIDRARFDDIANATPSRTGPARSHALSPSGRTLRVLEAGAHACIQDLGRPGFGAIGVSPSGAADRLSLRIGNRLVGNPDDSAGLEVTLTGARLRFEAEALVVLTGTPGEAEAIGPTGARAIHPCQPVRLSAGTELRFAPSRAGLRTYVCIAGAIDVPPTLGSRATHATTGLGPAPLRAGDLLGIGEPSQAAGSHDREALVGLIRTLHARTLRVVEGPQTHALGGGGLASLADRSFRIDPASDRVGLRVAPDAPLRTPPDAGMIQTEGVVRGAIQLMPDASLVILGPDGAPTGGYPVVAYVATVDQDALAQRRPGERIAFEPISPAHARTLLLEREQALDRACPRAGGGAS